MHTKGGNFRAEIVLVFLQKKKFLISICFVLISGGISAYNAGPKNVQSYERMDIGTTKNDYANDVVARAKFYKRNGY